MKNHKPVHVKHVKCIFCTHSEDLCMHTKTCDLIMKKDSPVIQIIFRHKSFQIVADVKAERKNKVALAEEFSILIKCNLSCLN